MDGHQLRGARIHRDMLLVSSVCRRALGCEWGEEVGLSVVSGGGTHGAVRKHGVLISGTGKTRQAGDPKHRQRL